MVYPKERQRAAPPARQVRGSQEDVVGVEEEALVAEPVEEVELVPVLEVVDDVDV